MAKEKKSSQSFPRKFKFSDRKWSRLRFALEKKSRKNGDCIEWTGRRMKRPDGTPSYGYVRAVQGGVSKTFLVHRLAYWLNVADPGKDHVLHSCDNVICINPKHLRAGTHKENMQDAVDRGRHPTKIPAQDLPRIASLLRLGVPQRIIAKAWGVGEATISLLPTRAGFKKYLAAASATKEIQVADPQDNRT